MTPIKMHMSLTLEEAVAVANCLLDHGGSYAYTNDVLGRLLVDLLRDPKVGLTKYEFADVQKTSLRVMI